MHIAKDRVVDIEYVLFDARGRVIDGTEEGETLSYLHGSQELLPRLQEALDGRSAGDGLCVELRAADAYGRRDPKKVQVVPRSAFDPRRELRVGNQVPYFSPAGVFTMWVAEVDEERVVLDGNHPLAGRDLRFAILVNQVRDARPEELEKGRTLDGDDGESA